MNIGQLTALLQVNASQLNLAAGALKKFETEANTTLNKVQVKMDALSTSMKTMGTAMSVGLTLPIVGLGVVATKTFREYELNLAHIVGLTGTSREQTAQWNTQLLELAKSTAQGPSKLADALYFIASSGVDSSQAMDVLTVSAKSAQAGLGEVSAVADLVTSALNAYAGTGLTAAQITDQLVIAVREGKAEAPGFAEAIGYAIPIAAQLGVTFDQVAASMAAVSGVGVDVNTAALYLRQVLSDLLNPSQQARRALIDMGTSAEQLREELANKGLLPLLKTLSVLTEKNGKTMAAVFPEVRSLTEVLALTGKNVGHVSEIFAMVANETDGLNNALKPVVQTLDNQFKQAIANSQVALIKLGEALKGTVVAALNWISTAIQNVVGWLSSFSEENKKSIIQLGLFVAAAGPVLLILAALVKAFQVLSLAFMATPFGILVAAIAAATFGLSLFLNRTKESNSAMSSSRMTVEQYTKSIKDQERNITMANAAIDMRITKLHELDLAQLKVLRSDIQQQLTIAQNVINPPSKQLTDAFKKAQDELEAQLSKTPELTLADLGFDQKEIDSINFDQIVTKVKVFSAATQQKITEASERFNKLTKQLETTDTAIKKLASEQVNVSGYSKAADVLQKYNLELSKIDLQTQALGRTEQIIKDQINATKAALDAFAEAGIKTGNEVYELQLALKFLNMELEVGDEISKNAKKYMDEQSKSTKRLENRTVQLQNKLAILAYENSLVGDSWDASKGDKTYTLLTGRLQIYRQELQNLFELQNAANKPIISPETDKEVQEITGHILALQEQLVQLDASKYVTQNLGNAFRNLASAINSVYSAAELMGESIGGGAKEFAKWIELIVGTISTVADLVKFIQALAVASKADAIAKNTQAVSATIATTATTGLSVAAVAATASNVGLTASNMALAAALTSTAVAGAMAASSWIPFPGNLAAMTTSAATLLTTLASTMTAAQAITAGVKLADGGIVPPGYPNDTYPAFLTSGEMVTPPGKLPQSNIGRDKSDNSGSVEFEIRGDVLYGILKKYNTKLQTY